MITIYYKNERKYKPTIHQNTNAAFVYRNFFKKKQFNLAFRTCNNKNYNFRFN